ncbi:hypothetical protein Tco_0634791 [Tanacetum coccineum]
MDKACKQRSPSHNLRQKPGQYICCQNHMLIVDIEDDIMDLVMQCTTLPRHSGFSQQKLVSFVTEIPLSMTSHSEIVDLYRSKLEYKFQDQENSEDIFSFGSALEDFICVVFVPDRNIAPFLNDKMMSVHISSGLVLHQMTSDHNRSELGIQDHSNEQSSSKLVPKVVPLAVKTATSRQELELLFHHHIAMLRTTGRKAHLLEDKQIPSVGVFDEVFLALGWHLEEIHVTWAHLEKKRTRLRTYTKSLEESCSQSMETASQA